MVAVSSIVLFAGDAERTAAFYRALGVALEVEDHGDGPEHLAVDLQGVHFAIFRGAGDAAGRLPELREAGSAFVGFYVESLDRAVDAVRGLDARILAEHAQRPWGCRALVEDPDGRAVEINQRDHCPM
jgi:lactoylglutathione lyase